MSKISKICDYNNCVGCSLCASVCPVNAIDMVLKSGFYRPEISDKCISCKKCINNCPSNSIKKINELKNDSPLIAYATWNINNDIHKNSSSGGIAYTIAKKIISKGGFAVGVWFNSDTQQVEHRIYENNDDLHLMQGSKYVQSNKYLIYNKVIELLKIKQGVFIGVPCEVFAMMQIMNNNKSLRLNKLYYIDILCHGGASPLCLSQHIKKITKKKIDNISFRGGDYDCRLVLWKNNKSLYQGAQFKDPYFNSFMKHTILQPACFNCNFCGSKRVGDITLGDFWGLDKNVEKKTHIQGINMMLVNNENGDFLLSEIKNDVYLEERNINEAINGNETLQYPTKKENEYDELWDFIRNASFHKAYKKVYKTRWSKFDWKVEYIKINIKKKLKRLIRRNKTYEKI